MDPHPASEATAKTASRVRAMQRVMAGGCVKRVDVFVARGLSSPSSTFFAKLNFLSRVWESENPVKLAPDLSRPLLVALSC